MGGDTIPEGHIAIFHNVELDINDGVAGLDDF